MQNFKVNYMIGTWSGPRAEQSFDDKFLERHLAQFSKVKHPLISQISIGYPYNPQEKLRYTQWITNLNRTADGTPIKVYPMDNIGRSYGQWSKMFDLNRNKFTHFLFIEDDYVPVLDEFDKILVEMFEEKHKDSNCGFLCGLVLDESGRYGATYVKHAAIANGVASNETLSNVWKLKECLPHDHSNIYSHGQISFSQGFLEAGYSLQEYLGPYRCLYWQHSPQIRIYWDGVHKQDLIVPIQFIDRRGWEFVEYRIDTPTIEKNPILPILNEDGERIKSQKSVDNLRSFQQHPAPERAVRQPFRRSYQQKLDRPQTLQVARRRALGH